MSDFTSPKQWLITCAPVYKLKLNKDMFVGYAKGKIRKNLKPIDIDDEIRAARRKYDNQTNRKKETR